METFDENYYTKLADDFKKQKAFGAEIEKRLEAMKKELTAAVEKYGQPDSSGHIWLKVGDIELKRERRVSRSFDANAAEAWAKENGLWEELKQVVVIESISEDALLGYAWKNKDVSDTVQGFYVEKETWAFKA